MSSFILLLLVVPVLGLVLIVLNLILSPHKPYNEKQSSFECGFHSFLGQNRSQFSVSFFLFGLLFLIFDLEIVLIYPYAVSSHSNSSYGLIIVFIFLLILTAGFVFEIGKKALTINSKQNKNIVISNNVFSARYKLILSNNKKKYLKRKLS